MIATYVDDLLVFSKEPMAIINELKKIYILKGVGEPEYYLGGCLLYTSPSPRDLSTSRMPSSA